MGKYVPAFVVSVLLHVGIFLLAFITWLNTPKPMPMASIPVEIISDVPQHEMAAAPVEPDAVKPPEPIPAPPVPPTQPPVPAPVQPIPEPIKPQKKPDTPAKAPVAPPDKNGMKKPTPQKPTLDLDALSQVAATPSKANTKKQAQANLHPTNGQSNYGAAPNDAGQKVALDALTRQISKLWILSCDVQGWDAIKPQIKFTLSPNGRVIDGPDWVNQRGDPMWVSGAARATAAVNKGQPYSDLPDGLYNVPITITFDAHKACNGQ